MIVAELPKRGSDAFGSGEFHASRGSRKHKGIDYSCFPDSVIRSPVFGKVTKLGYPYADDLSFRYVQVTDEADNDHRFFYVEPGVKVGDTIAPGDAIGTAQDVAAKHSTANRKMKNHIHYEILINGTEVDPEDFWL